MNKSCFMQRKFPKIWKWTLILTRSEWIFLELSWNSNSYSYLQVCEKDQKSFYKKWATYSLSFLSHKRILTTEHKPEKYFIFLDSFCYRRITHSSCIRHAVPGQYIDFELFMLFSLSQLRCSFLYSVSSLELLYSSNVEH